MESLLQKVRVYFGSTIWEIDREPLNGARRVLLRLFQIMVVVSHDFRRDNCLMRASALTYTSLLSFVPLLAMMFALLKGLNVQNTLQPFILDKLAVGSADLVNAIVGYINNTHFGRLGMIGLLALVATVIALLSNVEESFNHICGVRETRSLFRKFADYSSVILVGPILMVAAISMTTSLQSQTFVQKLLEMAHLGNLTYLVFRIAPFVVMWFAFAALYIFMPNVRIRFGAAFIGGVVGGTLWQLAQYGYVNFQVGVARYNAIYGTMAALPVFMVWIYLSWVIVLLGLEVTYVFQNLRAIRRERSGRDFTLVTHELASLAMLLKICAGFQLRDASVSLDRLAEELRLPLRFAQGVLDEMVGLGLVVRVLDDEGEGRLQPAFSPDALRVDEVLTRLRDGNRENRLPVESPIWLRAKRLEGELRKAEAAVLSGITMRDLVEELEAGGATPRSDAE